MLDVHHPIISLLRRTLVLPSGVQGFLDWNTGIIRLNCDASDYAIRMRTPISDGGVKETFYHESHHFAQVLLCGYLFRHCASLRRVVDAVVSMNSQLTFEDKKKLRSLDKKYRDSHSNLMRCSESGLSSLDLVESLTFYLHSFSNGYLDTTSYQALLHRSNLSREYKHGYLVGVERLDQDRFHRVFPLVVQLSLCFESPPDTYVDLLGRWGVQELNEDTPLDQIMTYCQKEMPGFIGFAWESGEQHPVYEGVLQQIVDKGKDELFTTTMMNPMLIWDPELEPVLRRPIVLNHSASESNPMFRDYPVVGRGILIDPDDTQNALLEMCVGAEISKGVNLVEYLISKREH